MPKYDIGSAVVGDARPTTLDTVITPLVTKGATGDKETIFENNDWTTYNGAFNENPHLKNSILLRATWTWGRGWTADPETEVILDHFNGWGKDTAMEIFENLDIQAMICGNGYGEIIWDDADKRNFPINVKPLDPSAIRHVVDKKGILIRYEQIAKLGDKEPLRKFDPRDILHFAQDRIADNITGLSLLQVLTKNIIAQKEIDDDIQKVMHRESKPVILIKLKTDNPTKIAGFKLRVQEAMRMSTDNLLFLPDDEDLMTWEVLKINSPSPILIEWKNSLRKDFYSTIGSPELLSDSSGATESGGKVGILSNQQVVEFRQRKKEAQIWNQLRLRINLIAPESIAPALQQDANKDGQAQQLNFQPGEVGI